MRNFRTIAIIVAFVLLSGCASNYNDKASPTINKNTPTSNIKVYNTPTLLNTIRNNANPTPSVSKNELNIRINELAVFDKITKKNIYIGMNRGEVESILGLPSKKAGTQENTLVYSGLEICYRDNKVVALILNPKNELNPKNRYSTYKNISINSTKDKLIKSYGLGMDDDGGGILNTTSYYFRYSNDTFVNLKHEMDSWSKSDEEKLAKLAENNDDVYVYIFFYKGKTKYIDNILISDYKYAYELK